MVWRACCRGRHTRGRMWADPALASIDLALRTFELAVSHKSSEPEARSEEHLSVPCSPVAPEAPKPPPGALDNAQ